MKTMQRMAGLMALAALLIWGFPAEAGDFLHARVAFESGSSMVKGKDDADWSYATLNTLVVPNDTLWVDNEGMLELEMSGGTFLRMADGSKIEVASLPPAGVLRAATGAFYIQRMARSTGDIVFEAPACKIMVDQNSQVRVDIVGEGATTVSVRWGNAILKGLDGKDLALKEGERSFIDPGYLPSAPQPFDRSAEDAFDSWNRDRARLLALGTEAIPRTVIKETAVPVGVADLAPHGEWITVENQTYWRPTVVVDYVPYRSGYWTYVPDCGYTWVERYPFSYVTTHYGRWTHFDSCGWVWSYRETWGPAWVASYRVGPNFVWCPLDPWDRPCVVGADYFAVGSVHVGIYASSYCLAADLLLGPCVVSPCVVDMGFHDIHVWNHYAPSYHHPAPVNINYGDTVIINNNYYAPQRVVRGPSHTPVVSDNGLTRDYFPSRSIRDGGRPAGPAPRERVARLEPSARSVGFGTERVTPSRSIRATEVRPEAASTRLRQTRVEPGALNTTRDLTNRVSERAAGGGLTRESGIRSIRSTQTLGTPESRTDRRAVTPETGARRESAPTVTTRREVREAPTTRRETPSEQTAPRTPERSVRGNAGDSGQPAQSLRGDTPRTTERRSVEPRQAESPRVSVRQEAAPRTTEPRETRRESSFRSTPTQERRTQETPSLPQTTTRRQSESSRSSDAFSGLRSVRPMENRTQLQPQTRRTAPAPTVSSPRRESSPFLSGSGSSSQSRRQSSSPSPSGSSFGSRRSSESPSFGGGSIRSNGGSSRSMSAPQSSQPRSMSAPSDSGRRSTGGGGGSVRSGEPGGGRESRSRR